MILVNRLSFIRGADWPTQLREKVNIFNNVTVFMLIFQILFKKESVFHP